MRKLEAMKNQDQNRLDQLMKLTEKPRTYQIDLVGGGVIFKMYKPSYMAELKQAGWPKAWKKVQIVSRTA